MSTVLELEQQVQDYLKTDDSISFAQKDEIGFEMPKLPFLDKRIVMNAIGASAAAVVGGSLGAFMPASLQAISGAPQLIVGTVLKYVLKGKGGKMTEIVDGVLISGLSQVISGLISRGGIPLQQEIKGMFQQKAKQEQVELEPIKNAGDGIRW